MFRNYFKTAWRNLIKQKTLAFINVFGLSVGIACFSLFTLYAINEFNYDKFHQNRANIYRVYNQSTAKDANPASGFSYQPMPLGPALVAVAFVIATPLACYFMNRWLQDYANRIHITWWVFAATGAVMLGIALVTISFQAIKAAFASPTSSLR